jgi:cytidylate kinase
VPDPGHHASTVIAVDGPSGSGKSSVSRGVAQRLGLRYLDTGAMYRAVTLWMLDHGVDVEDAAEVAEHAAFPDVHPGSDPAAPSIVLDGVEVSAAVREPRVTAAVSAVSAVPEVRERLVALQRLAVDGGGIVVEGRDIGTVVCPDATVKVFLTASPEARASRRSLELAGAGHPDAMAAATLADLARRDAVDSTRAVSPLAQAVDAEVVDATHRSLQATIDAVVALADARVPGDPA